MGSWGSDTVDAVLAMFNARSNTSLYIFSGLNSDADSMAGYCNEHTSEKAFCENCGKEMQKNVCSVSCPKCGHKRDCTDS